MGNSKKISKGKPTSIIIQICILLNPSTVMFIKETKTAWCQLKSLLFTSTKLFEILYNLTC
jgi:hypothetical protein